jgi:hypothetical protein
MTARVLRVLRIGKASTLSNVFPALVISFVVFILSLPLRAYRVSRWSDRVSLMYEHMV